MAPSPKPDRTKKTKAAEQEDKRGIRSRILDAAAKVFLTHGFAKARISQIITLSGVSRSSVYDNFSGKEALITALVDRAYEDGLEKTEQILEANASASEGIRQWLRGTLHLEERYRNLIKILHQDNAMPNSLLNKQESLANFRVGMKPIRQVLRRGVEAGEFRDDLNINRTAQTLQNFHHMLGLVRAQEDSIIDFLGEDGDMVVDFIVAGLQKKPETAKSGKAATARRSTRRAS